MLLNDSALSISWCLINNDSIVPWQGTDGDEGRGPAALEAGEQRKAEVTQAKVRGGVGGGGAQKVCQQQQHTGTGALHTEQESPVHYSFPRIPCVSGPEPCSFLSPPMLLRALLLSRRGFGRGFVRTWPCGVCVCVLLFVRL